MQEFAWGFVAGVAAVGTVWALWKDIIGPWVQRTINRNKFW